MSLRCVFYGCGVVSYDFNATYGPLNVYNQESEGACVTYAIDTCVAAQLLMQTGHLPTWPDDGVSYPRLVQGGFQPDGSYVDYYVTMEGTQHSVRCEASQDDRSPDHLKALLLASGAATLGVVSTGSFVNPPPSGGLPVIRPLSSDVGGQGHDCVAVGFTDAGVVVQNSYGLGWGCRGRAVLSWEWLGLYCDTFQRLRVDDYPIDGATKAPLPVKEFRMLLAQRTPASPVFAFLGGVRVWIWSRTVLPTQGLSMTDVKVVDASDPIWTLPIVGKQPPADN